MNDECMVYNVKELQKVLGIGRDTAYALMRSRAFPSIKISGRFFVEKEALRIWLKHQEGKEFLM